MPRGIIDYQSFFIESPDVHVVTSEFGVFHFVSPGSLALFGWDPTDLVGRNEDEFAHLDDVAFLRESRDKVFEGAEHATATYRFLCRDGSYRWTEARSCRVQADRSALVLSSLRDVSERHQLTMALKHEASTDPLTGVANRTVLMDRLRQGLRRMERGNGVLAVLYVDLDRFKIVNDSLGHRVGDAILLKMAERLTHHIRPADTLARLGGDEFVIVAEAMVDEYAASALAKRIIEAGREPFRVGSEEFVCTLSVGVAFTSDSQRAAEDLLREADLALYRAKDRGRDRAEVFDEELQTKAVGRLVTERMLRRALDANGLVVQYQPIIDLGTGGAVGSEALVRMRDPTTEGLLHPDSFLEVAEESGLLIAMDEQVLADAIKQISGWRVRLAGTEFVEVAINVTARHLADVGFQRSVVDQLSAHGVEPANLQLEVTERVLMEASNSAITGLRGLREIGVQVGLDDFGTGYSSLAYLRQFPLDFVKIDKSFIDDLVRVNGNLAIVAAIISLAHALGLTVVAEGVETEEQLRILEDLDCDRAQGFLFAASVEPCAIDEFVHTGRRPAFDVAL
ncbi:MAG TPA: EAL domain-containing protein [Acidimicrobiales bacterium]|nr:EAL domain-containing protein [Acidimicrobiales bacterium]